MDKISKEEFESLMKPLLKKFTDCFHDAPIPDDPEQSRMIVISALCEVVSAVIAQTESPDLTLGVVWRHTQFAASKYAHREVEPLCPCPDCKAEREQEGTGADTSMQMH